MLLVSLSILFSDRQAPHGPTSASFYLEKKQLDLLNDELVFTCKRDVLLGVTHVLQHSRLIAGTD